MKMKQLNEKTSIMANIAQVLLLGITILATIIAFHTIKVSREYENRPILDVEVANVDVASMSNCPIRFDLMVCDDEKNENKKSNSKMQFLKITLKNIGNGLMRRVSFFDFNTGKFVKASSSSSIVKDIEVVGGESFDIGIEYEIKDKQIRVADKDSIFCLIIYENLYGNQYCALLRSFVQYQDNFDGVEFDKNVRYQFFDNKSLGFDAVFNQNHFTKSLVKIILQKAKKDNPWEEAIKRGGSEDETNSKKEY